MRMSGARVGSWARRKDWAAGDVLLLVLWKINGTFGIVNSTNELLLAFGWMKKVLQDLELDFYAQKRFVGVQLFQFNSASFPCEVNDT